MLVSGARCCGQWGDAGEISASEGTHYVTSACLQPFVVFKVLIQHKKEKNQLLVFIRKSNSFYFPYTQMNIYFSKTKWNKNNNSLTSTFYFSIAGTCVFEAADPEAHLRLHPSCRSNTHAAVQDLCKHCCGVCGCKIVKGWFHRDQVSLKTI